MYFVHAASLLSAADIYVLSLDGHYSKYIASPINLIHLSLIFVDFFLVDANFLLVTK